MLRFRRSVRNRAVILALIAEIDPATPIVFLDTGWHFVETIAYRDRLAGLLGLTNLRSVTPAAPDLYREDRDNQLHADDPDRCCHIRKVLPLERALAGYEAWITGRKRYHGGERSQLDVIEDVDGRIKINPLAGWTLGADRGRIPGATSARASPGRPGLSVGRLRPLHVAGGGQ